MGAPWEGKIRGMCCGNSGLEKKNSGLNIIRFEYHLALNKSSVI